MDRESLLKHPLTLIAAIFIFLLIFDRLGLKLPISVISQDRGAPLVVEGTGKVVAVAEIVSESVSARVIAESTKTQSIEAQIETQIAQEPETIQTPTSLPLIKGEVPKAEGVKEANQANEAPEAKKLEPDQTAIAYRSFGSKVIGIFIKFWSWIKMEISFYL